MFYFQIESDKISLFWQFDKMKKVEMKSCYKLNLSLYRLVLTNVIDRKIQLKQNLSRVENVY